MYYIPAYIVIISNMHSYAGIDVLLRDITKKGTAIKIEGAHNE